MIIKLNAKEAHKIICMQLNVPAGTDVEIICGVKNYLLPATIALNEGAQNIILPEGYIIDPEANG